MKVKNFLELAYKTLKKVQAPLTDKQIWEKSQELGLQVESVGKTPWKTIGARIYVDIKDNPDTTKFKKVGSRPALFFINDGEIVQAEEEKIKKNATDAKNQTEKYKEKDLHPLLAYFLKNDPRFSCAAKTIIEKGSHKGKKGENEWLHPDMVGIHFSFEDYNEKLVELIDKFNVSKCTLFSFEIKREVNFSNLRQCYFQAVSNSSWANEGYLVALEYESDPAFQEEMKRLANSFGIGFIQLNVNADGVEESQILFPARHKEELDWDTINKLIEVENTDFLAFIGKIKQVFKYKEIIEEKDEKGYDKVLSDDELKKYIEEKKIPKNIL